MPVYSVLRDEEMMDIWYVTRGFADDEMKDEAERTEVAPSPTIFLIFLKHAWNHPQIITITAHSPVQYMHVAWGHLDLQRFEQ